MIPFDELKAKQRDLREGFPADMALRVHRAISWIGRAQKETDDPDAAFLFYWIAFNAAYADETDADRLMSEHEQFVGLLRRIVTLDRETRLHKELLRLQKPISTLIENKYVFRPFWLNLNGVSGNENWETKFSASAKTARRSMNDNDIARQLQLVFERLYVLRCQIMHGSATWGSNKNREQVRGGAKILGTLMPVMIDLMMDNPDEDWGTPLYPSIGPRARGASGSAILSRWLAPGRRDSARTARPT